jgi:hypothetical protein
MDLVGAQPGKFLILTAGSKPLDVSVNPSKL